MQYFITPKFRYRHLTTEIQVDTGLLLQHLPYYRSATDLPPGFGATFMGTKTYLNCAFSVPVNPVNPCPDGPLNFLPSDRFC